MKIICIHIYLLSFTYVCMCVCMYVCTYTFCANNMCVHDCRICTYMCAHAQSIPCHYIAHATYKNTNMQTHIHKYMHTHTENIHACMHVCMHEYIHTYIPTYILTYIRAYPYDCPLCPPLTSPCNGIHPPHTRACSLRRLCGRPLLHRERRRVGTTELRSSRPQPFHRGAGGMIRRNKPPFHTQAQGPSRCTEGTKWGDTIGWRSGEGRNHTCIA